MQKLITADEASKISFENNTHDQDIVEINQIIKGAALKGEREVKCYLKFSPELIKELEANGFFVKRFGCLTNTTGTGNRISWYS